MKGRAPSNEEELVRMAEELLERWESWVRLRAGEAQPNAPADEEFELFPELPEFQLETEE